MNLDHKSVADIPLKYFDIKSKVFPSAGICIDAYPKDFSTMIRNCQSTPEKDYELWQSRVQSLFTPAPSHEKTHVSLCVRTAFDNYLQCRKFPRGSEVIMTAINIPDMVQIINEHGLVPVPVDIDPYTMAPTLDAIKAATTEMTRVCIFAHIYGVTYELDPFADYLQQLGIEII